MPRIETSPCGCEFTIDTPSQEMLMQPWEGAELIPVTVSGWTYTTDIEPCELHAPWITKENGRITVRPQR